MTTILTEMVARLLLLPILVIATAVLVKGYADVGDGFSAGVIAAMGILLQYVACGHQEVRRRLPIHLAPKTAVAGLLLALLVAFVPMLQGAPLLAHFPPAGAEEVVHLGTLELHSAVLVDVGIFLLIAGFLVSVMDLVAQVAEQRLS